MKVTVWTTTVCQSCVMTKKQFDRFGVNYEEQSLEENPLMLEGFKEQGFTSSPIVVAGDKIWSGFRLDQIKSVAHQLFGADK